MCVCACVKRTPGMERRHISSGLRGDPIGVQLRESRGAARRPNITTARCTVITKLVVLTTHVVRAPACVYANKTNHDTTCT